jgi:hypothetical protein
MWYVDYSERRREARAMVASAAHEYVAAADDDAALDDVLLCLFGTTVVVGAKVAAAEDESGRGTVAVDVLSIVLVLVDVKVEEDVVVPFCERAAATDTVSTLVTLTGVSLLLTALAYQFQPK